ncbi:MAG: GntR family transcriptional regulator [Desulfovibrio sp.]|uniref:GntR family transcriptional regulator n=1 Tax=Desulfovibrio sp. TaxID=885 RepID=UPI00135E1663|nr:GntR family transcriptional regulator [Desulfovibrio sp.]MTJ91511.1 GntR family transcriptional regulator [Desulfovibrio sp.]
MLNDRKKQAYNFLRNAIISNEIAAGSPIREQELTKRLKMSRTPIREAMRELEKDGLLISYPARGTFVLVVTPSDVAEIYDLRILCELWALEQGLPRMHDNEIEIIDRLTNEAEANVDWEKFHLSDLLLHNLIIEKSYNKRLVSFIQAINGQIERIRRFNAKGKARYDLGIVEHKKILNALFNRNLPAAKKALEEHLRTSRSTAIEIAKMFELQSVPQKS